MIQKLYVNNFRCLENFELPLKGIPSSLLIGKNGSGKSTIASALEMFQQIGRGNSRVGQLVKPSDFTRGNSAVPIRFEIEVLLNKKSYKYVLAFELPEHFTELRILEEEMLVEGKRIYFRKLADVILYRNANKESSFFVDWHIVALPIIQTQSGEPLHIFQSWLANMIILSPIPNRMKGDSSGSTLHPERDVSNFGEWLTGLLLGYPAAYSLIDKYIHEVMPDFDSLQNELLARDARYITVQFRKEQASFSVDFNQLSDGEKCFFLSAVVIATNKHLNPLFCFWDEPDNYLSLPEVGHFVTELRRSFKNSGQLLLTSHNAQAIEKFSDENTFVLDRKSHLEPTLLKLLDEMPKTEDLISALIGGDISL
jgi:predicted ATPase